jgi:hypothetical protein
MPFAENQRIVLIQTDDANFELVEPITYLGNTDRFEVAAGSGTDLASVPKPLQWLIPRYGRYTKAAILHDYLWRSGVVSKRDADGIFRRAMRELGVPTVRRWMMWAAVRSVSAVTDLRTTLKAGVVSFLGLLAVAVLSLGFVLVPLAVVSVWLLLFWVVEAVAWVVGWIRNRIVPARDRTKLNPPRPVVP